MDISVYRAFYNSLKEQLITFQNALNMEDNKNVIANNLVIAIISSNLIYNKLLYFDKYHEVYNKIQNDLKGLGFTVKVIYDKDVSYPHLQFTSSSYNNIKIGLEDGLWADIVMPFGIEHSKLYNDLSLFLSEKSDEILTTYHNLTNICYILDISLHFLRNINTCLQLIANYNHTKLIIDKFPIITVNDLPAIYTILLKEESHNTQLHDIIYSIFIFMNTKTTFSIYQQSLFENIINRTNLATKKRRIALEDFALEDLFDPQELLIDF